MLDFILNIAKLITILPDNLFYHSAGIISRTKSKNRRLLASVFNVTICFLFSSYCNNMLVRINFHSNEHFPRTPLLAFLNPLEQSSK